MHTLSPCNALVIARPFKNKWQKAKIQNRTFSRTGSGRIRLQLSTDSNPLATTPIYRQNSSMFSSHICVWLVGHLYKGEPWFTSQKHLRRCVEGEHVCPTGANLLKASEPHTGWSDRRGDSRSCWLRCLRVRCVTSLATIKLTSPIDYAFIKLCQWNHTDGVRLID